MRSEQRKAAANALKVGKVTRETVNDQVYRRLREAIAGGGIEPDATMTMRSLAAAVGTSVMPVRAALQRLVAEGALEVHANRRVSLPPMTLGRFDELTRIRVELEGLATECAVLHAAPKDLDRLARLNDELVILAHKKKLSDYLARNRQFHLLLYGLSDMQELLAIIDSLWLRIGPFLNHSRVALLAAHDSDDNILRNHALAIEALRRGDGPAARAAIGRDLTEAAAVIRTTLQARDTAVA